MAATNRPRYRLGAIAKGVNGGECCEGFPRAGLSITTPVAASAESDADWRKVKCATCMPARDSSRKRRRLGRRCVGRLQPEEKAPLLLSVGT